MTSTTRLRRQEEVALIIGSVVVAPVICLGRIWIAAALGLQLGPAIECSAPTPP